MEKIEALSEIMMCIEQVKEADRFKDKAKLLKTLHKLYDMVNLYKSSGNYFELCAKEAKKLIDTLTEGLNGGKKRRL